MSKKVKIILLIVWVLSAFLFLFTRSKAESDGSLFPIPTFNPDPSAGRDIYDSWFSPSPTSPPERPPVGEDRVTPDPFLVTPAPSAEPLPTPASALYSNFVYDSQTDTYINVFDSYSSFASVPMLEMTRFNSGWRVTNLNFSLPFSVLDSADDYAYIQFRPVLRPHTFVPPGGSISLSIRNPYIRFTQYAPLTDLSAPNVGINVSVTSVFGNQTFVDSFDISVSQFQNGFVYDLENTFDTNLTTIRVEITITNLNPVLDDGSIVPILIRSGNNHGTSYMYPYLHGAPVADNDTGLLNGIGGFFRGFLDILMSIFVPSPSMIQGYITAKSVNPQDSSLGPAWTLGLRILQIFSNVQDTPPSLTLPAFSINVGGGSYQLWDSFSVDFSSIPPNLLTYSRMCGDILLAWAFFSWLGRKFRSLFSVKFADTVDTVSDEIVGGDD